MATLQTDIMRTSGVDVVGDIPWGTHFCLFYETKADLLETLVSYCGAGLQNQEFCLWVVAPPVTRENALDALRHAVPDFDGYLLEGGIEIVAAEDWYLQDGTFDLNRVIAGWNETLRRASSRGYVGVRVTGDTAWLERKDWKDFCEYEESLNAAIANQRLAVLCTYPLAACGAEEILDVVRTHQFAVTKRRGGWDVIETAGHKMAKAEIKRLNQELEQRVIERTRQLAAVNEELTREVVDRKKIEALLTRETRTLEMVAKGDPLSHILDGLCRIVEEQAPGVLASVLLVDGDRLRHGGAPNLPKAYTEAIDGAVIGPTAGSCGTAAFCGKQVIVEDIATDPLWADYRGLALPHSLRACWSTPIFSLQGKVIATFGVYYREPRRPSLRDLEIIEQMTHLAGVAIERKLAQEALRSSEAYLTQAQRLVHLGTWVWKVNGRQADYVSDEWYRIYGFVPDDGVPGWEDCLERVHPEDRGAWQSAIERAIRDEADYEIDFRILLPTGNVKYLHTVGHAVPGESAPDSLRFIGTTMDVTERKRIEQTLRQSQAYLAEAQRLTHTGSWAWNAASKSVVHWSEETFRIFGFDLQEGIPSRDKFWERVHPDDRARVMTLFEQSGREGQEFTDNFRVVLPDGSVRHIHVSGHPVVDARGNVIEVFGTHVDITERRRAEQERERLHQLEADLAHMNRVSMMGELAASLAHEIKQPITAAATNARTSLRWLQRETPEIAQAREAVSRIVNDVIRAAEIIDRNRSLYRRETPKREMVNLNELIREMIVLLHDKAHQHSVAIRTEFDGELSSITADPVQLQQVLMNLMLNGIEAMKDTGGELTVRSGNAEDDQVLVSVSDSGPGLPVDDSERLFEAFFTTKAQGTGMGLSVSRRIIESHGGRLWASGNAGKGATFHFKLPGEPDPLFATSE